LWTGRAVLRLEIYLLGVALGELQRYYKFIGIVAGSGRTRRGTNLAFVSEREVRSVGYGGIGRCGGGISGLCRLPRLSDGARVFKKRLKASG